jgi:hypothetical protein
MMRLVVWLLRVLCALDTADQLTLLGAVLIVGGIACWSVPLALLVAGVLAIGAGQLQERGE